MSGVKLLRSRRGYWQLRYSYKPVGFEGNPSVGSLAEILS
jgi:hypothetical protein